MSNTGKSKAMKLANWGSGLGFAGLVLSPLFGISGVVLGIMAFRARAEEEKSGWDGSSVNNRALTAIIAGIICSAVDLVAASTAFFPRQGRHSKQVFIFPFRIRRFHWLWTSKIIRTGEKSKDFFRS